MYDSDSIYNSDWDHNGYVDGNDRIFYDDFYGSNSIDNSYNSSSDDYGMSEDWESGDEDSLDESFVEPMSYRSSSPLIDDGSLEFYTQKKNYALQKQYIEQKKTQKLLQYIEDANKESEADRAIAKKVYKILFVILLIGLYVSFR